MYWAQNSVNESILSLPWHANLLLLLLFKITHIRYKIVENDGARKTRLTFRPCASSRTQLSHYVFITEPHTVCVYVKCFM